MSIGGCWFFIVCIFGVFSVVKEQFVTQVNVFIQMISVLFENSEERVCGTHFIFIK